MSNPSFDFFRSKFNISKDTFAILESLSRKKTLKSGEKIIKEGGIGTKVYFLTSGLMRAVLTTESGKEVTKNIFPPISFVGPFSSILKEKPSLLCYETLTDCTGYEVDFKAFYTISKTNIEISNLYNRILEFVFIMYEKKQLETLSLNATERYEILKQQIPNIDNQIAQYQIASYLNITPVQLSRIRKVP